MEYSSKNTVDMAEPFIASPLGCPKNKKEFKLLVLCPAFPYPPRSGGDIRLFELLKHMAPYCEIHLLSFIDGSHNDMQQASGIARSYSYDRARTIGANSWVRGKFNAWKGSPHGLSLKVEPGYAARVRDLVQVERYDAVLIEYLYMFQYAKFCGRTPVFFSAPNVETLKYARWYKGHVMGPVQRLRCVYQQNAIRRLESGVGKRARIVFVTSDYDKEELLAMNRNGHFVTVPNGADIDYFMPREQTSFEKTPSVLFVGSLFYKPNADAVAFLANEVMPIIRNEIANCECHIVGNTAQRDLSSFHQPEKGVFLHGCVPDIRPFLLQSQVLAVPLFVGSGTRIKILEAMASGTPVVSTRIGAEGIDYCEDENILLADTASQMANAIKMLISNPHQAAQMGRAGRRLVEEKYTWKRSAAIMQTEIETILNAR